MTLPESDQVWPPKPFDPIFAKLAEWSSWYAGDPDALAKVYGGLSALPSNRPGQLRGGVVGKLSRWFWGQPAPIGQQRTKLHVPIAADIATASADLLFAEEVQMVVQDQPDTVQERFDWLLDKIGWSSLLPEAAEVCSALGGVYLRTTWDTEVADHPLVTAVHADSAVPEFRFGRLRAVTFWRVVESDDQKVVRHLEKHMRGRVQHGLYQGTWDKLGRLIPLTESEATKDFEVDKDASIATGFDGLTATYVPNIRPNRRWRSDPAGADLGRSDLDGVEQLMDALDECYTSWMRDIRLGKARILIPRNLLETGKPGEGASFDMDREVFVELADMAGSAASEKLQLTAQQFEIRYQEHAETAQGLLSQIVRAAGYSGQTFGLTSDTEATATEVHARERRSDTTREKKTRYWSDALAEVAAAVTAIDREVFKQGPGPVEVKVEFPPASQTSPLELAQTAQALRAAGAASTKTLVRMQHPEWDDPAVDDEVALIMSEEGMQVTNPDDPGPGQLPGEPPLPVNEQPGIPVDR